MRTLLFITIILFAGCKKDNLGPDAALAVEYHLSNPSDVGEINVKTLVKEGVFMDVYLGNNSGIVYRDTIPSSFQIYATYITEDDIKDNFRFWIVCRGKEIHIKTKQDVKVRDGKNIVAISGILASEL